MSGPILFMLEGIMYEILPIVAGISIGLLTQRLRSSNLQIITLLVLSAFFSVYASYISGELLISWICFLLDTVFVMLAAITWWTRRTSHLPQRNNTYWL